MVASPSIGVPVKRTRKWWRIQDKLMKRKNDRWEAEADAYHEASELEIAKFCGRFFDRGGFYDYEFCYQAKDHTGACVFEPRRRGKAKL